MNESNYVKIGNEQWDINMSQTSRPEEPQTSKPEEKEAKAKENMISVHI